MAKQILQSVADIDKHVYDHTKKFKLSPKLDNVKPGAINLCQAYTMARPILIFAKSLLFFRPVWVAAITGVIAALDTQCNVTQ